MLPFPQTNMSSDQNYPRLVGSKPSLPQVGWISFTPGWLDQFYPRLVGSKPRLVGLYIRVYITQLHSDYHKPV